MTDQTYGDISPTDGNDGETINFCPYCGTKVGPAYSFCQNCGMALPTK